MAWRSPRGALPLSSRTGAPSPRSGGRGARPSPRSCTRRWRAGLPSPRRMLHAFRAGPRGATRARLPPPGAGAARPSWRISASSPSRARNHDQAIAPSGAGCSIDAHGAAGEAHERRYRRRRRRAAAARPARASRPCRAGAADARPTRSSSRPVRRGALPATTAPIASRYSSKELSAGGTPRPGALHDGRARAGEPESRRTRTASSQPGLRAAAAPHAAP